ncbi:MAG: hypothetical protein H0V71_07760 [Chloroflexi bacterium]|nr:hypothetical protein [Chloroflexota bacterium]
MSERLPRPVVRSEFRVHLREELLREAPSALVPAAAPRSAWWRPLAAACAAVLVLVAADMAAAQSLPGEPPFAIKSTAEEVRLLVATTRATRIDVLGERAERRLGELRRAAAQQRPAVAAESSLLLADALDRLAVEVLRAKQGDRTSEDDQAVRKAERIAEQHASAIDALLPIAPAAAKAALERAAEQARKIRAP